MILLGGPVFVSADDPQKWVAAHSDAGYRAAYVPDIKITDTARIQTFKTAAAERKLAFAETGAWCNLIAVDPAKRAANLKHTENKLTLADEIGAGCCVTFIGTLDPNSDYGPHPLNLEKEGFDQAVAACRAVIDAVKPKRAKFSLEMMQWVLPDSVDSYEALIKAVDRKEFGVHLDPVNMIVSPRLFYHNGDMIRETFKRLGKWVVSAHAKDLVLKNQLALHLDEIRPGLGNLDYAAYLKGLAALPNDTPLMLEHLSNETEYKQAAEHLRSVAKKEGLPI